MSDQHYESGMPMYSMSQQDPVVAYLEMAADSEKLDRYAQAEHLYKRAFFAAKTTVGHDSPVGLAILFDLSRVCEKQGH